MPAKVEIYDGTALPSELCAGSREVSKLFDITHKHLRETIVSTKINCRSLGFCGLKPLNPRQQGGLEAVLRNIHVSVSI